MTHNPLEEYYSKDNLNFLAYILNSTWKSQFEATGEIMKKRINSGSLFVFMYGQPTDEEKEIYEDICKTKLEQNYEIPLGVLETIAIKTEGNLFKVPYNYDNLTNYGNWKSPEKNSDTLVLVDITVLDTRKGKKGNGEAKTIVKYALENLISTPFEYVLTYTPKIKPVISWHEKLGAINTRQLVVQARPNFVEPDVCIMNYTKRLEELRK